MSDEFDDDYHQLWQSDMPLISIPTQTFNPYGVRPGGQPASLTAVSVPGTTDFVLGVDTCGFTTASTITCEFGYECTNVEGYRGCCFPGADDCASTIYTDCIDYGKALHVAECGPQTLCCPSTHPSCYTYWFDNDDNPQETFRHIECQTSQGFGILYPFPPELTMTSDTSTTETDSPSDTSNSTQITIESEGDSLSRSSISAGAIVGAVVGSVAFVIISAIIAALIFRRRRAKKNAATAPSVPVKSTDSSTDILPSPEKEPRQTTAAAAVRSERPPTRRSFLRPLSMIQENPISISKPIPLSATSFAPGIRRYKSAAARQSPRPNWPLSPLGNPLGSHPVDANLMKRLSDSRLGTRGLESGGISDGRQKSLPRIPVLPFRPPPPPPPPGTKPVTPLPPLKPSRDFESTGTTPTSATAALQSPRLSRVPVSPIMSRVLDGISPHRAVNNPSTSTTRPISAVGPEPVSPIGSDGEGEGADNLPRLSYVSAPSAAGEGGLERDDMVSPIGVDEVDSDTEVPESLVTVSPLESPRGSMDS
ncbi:uncharacterized protein F4817DRAFT_364744 [Daldinia loculata]|uniref:uncharacterized protein n=1 Tax=Daldinia loculata TaxID=103429 RepID=UPI0020C34EF8|nr:uncharacterized protein F4817DRAFT_364744 [Daldinia loculata]KAI1651788.1 hypothetical protein F4817DRAFT_364744 [Daldinia loculata]